MVPPPGSFKKCRGHGRFLIFLFELNLATTELDLASVFPLERSEASVAISIIKNMNMAVSQRAPAKISSGGRVCSIAGPLIDPSPLLNL